MIVNFIHHENYPHVLIKNAECVTDKVKQLRNKKILLTNFFLFFFDIKIFQ